VVETAVAWKAAIERRQGPTSLVFSRQKVPHQSRTPDQVAEIRRGGYILADCQGTPQAIIIATGSEVGLARQAAAVLAEKGKKVRVVSMPSVDVFEAQDAAYRERVLPAAVSARLVVEAAVTAPWYKYVGMNGRVIGLDRFGESAPSDVLFKYFGFTVENVVRNVEELL
jgi:transketolase